MYPVANVEDMLNRFWLEFYTHTTPLHEQDVTTLSIFDLSLPDLNSGFLLDWLQYKDSSLPYYLPIVGFIPFPRVLMLCEIQTLIQVLNSVCSAYFVWQ